MNKLQTVREALERESLNKDSDVKLVGHSTGYNKDGFSGRKGFGVHYITCPEVGIYDMAMLWDFMGRLVPELKPDEERDYCKLGKAMNLGAYSFYEEGIAVKEIHEKTTFSLEDQDISNLIEKYQKEKVRKEKLNLTIGVYAAPNEELARSLMERPLWWNDGNRYILMKEIRKSRKKNKVGMTLPMNRLS